MTGDHLTPEAAIPNDDQLVERFASVTQWRRGAERAPHKPLLLLYALARLQRGEPRLVSFGQLDEPFRALLRDFGPPRKSFHPEYPFWHLQSDELWQIPEIAALEAARIHWHQREVFRGPARHQG